MGMRVLFLTCHLPYPPVSGGRRREFELLRRLADHVDLTVYAVSKTYDEDVANAPELSRYAQVQVQVVPAEPVRASDPAVPFQVLRHRTRQVAPVLSAGDHDVVHVEGFYLMQHVRRAQGVPVVLAEQNIEYQLWEQRAAHAHGRVAWRHKREADRTRRAEQAAWRRADVVAAITEDDRAVIRAAGIPDVRLVPDGIDLPQGRPATREPDRPVLTFVGNFGYEPNVDAARYFVAEVLPLVVAQVPEAQLLLVGNDPPAEVRALAGPNVTVTGRVPDVGQYLRDAAVIVCPLRVGGGVKVKMLEALASSKAIVTTSVGTQGLGSRVSDAVEVADEPAPMAAAVVQLLNDPERRRSLERAADAFARTLPTWDDAADALLTCYEDAARRERVGV